MQKTMGRMVKLIEDLTPIVYIDCGAIEIEIHRYIRDLT